MQTFAPKMKCAIQVRNYVTIFTIETDIPLMVYVGSSFPITLLMRC